MTPPGHRWSWTEYGDAGVLVHLDDPDRETRWAAACGLGRALRKSKDAGIVDVVSTYEDVFVAFDPLRTDTAAVVSVVESAMHAEFAAPEGRSFVVPVLYGGEAGPDLASVADELGLPTDEVVRLHTGSPWTVRFVASPVGAPFLDGPSLPRSVARLATPWARVARNAVALSGRQTMIYPAPSPGGWRVIGRTPVRVFDPSGHPPVTHRAGDRFRFRAIDSADWARWDGVALADCAE